MPGMGGRFGCRPEVWRAFVQCRRALQDISLSAMRLEAVCTPSGDSQRCYNASPASMVRLTR